MSRFFFINAQGAQIGPIEKDEMLKIGITPSTLVWKEGTDNWITADKEHELDEYFASLHTTSTMPSQATDHHQNGAPLNDMSSSHMGEAMPNLAATSAATQTQYSQEGQKTKENLNSDNTTADSSKPEKTKKNNRAFKISFFITLALLVIAVVLGLMCQNKLSNELSDAKNELSNAKNELSNANSVISKIENICNNSVSEETRTFSNWTSSKHDDSKKYSFYGKEGDILSFYYDVDSESFDHFKAEIFYNGKSSIIELKDISGLDKYSTATYTLPEYGDYTLVVEYYYRDGFKPGRDNLRVYNIELKHSYIGEIAQEIISYYEKTGSKESIRNCDKENVVPDDIDAYAGDTCAGDSFAGEEIQ
ncbi:MAG: DUF4339 domain-containing protein [Bacteroidales bacterium]|nr:DUF4339 domain-containing protein [Bacteroidales bacterium]